MGCNCGKKKVATQPKKVPRPQNKPTTESLKRGVRVIRRSAY